MIHFEYFLQQMIYGIITSVVLISDYEKPVLHFKYKHWSYNTLLSMNFS